MSEIKVQALPTRTCFIGRSLSIARVQFSILTCNTTHFFNSVSFFAAIFLEYPQAVGGVGRGQYVILRTESDSFVQSMKFTQKSGYDKRKWIVPVCRQRSHGSGTALVCRAVGQVDHIMYLHELKETQFYQIRLIDVLRMRETLVWPTSGGTEWSTAVWNGIWSQLQ